MLTNGFRKNQLSNILTLTLCRKKVMTDGEPFKVSVMVLSGTVTVSSHGDSGSLNSWVDADVNCKTLMQL